MADSIAERVKRRRNSHVEDEDNTVQAPEVSLGEDVLFCKLIRDGILKHFNPCKLSDLQYVLELRCFKGLVSDEDLKEMYFKRAWGFREWMFPLATWQELSVGEMQRRVQDALPQGVPLPPSMADVLSLDTKESIMREYGALAYVPYAVYRNAVRGAHVLRTIRQVGVENMDGTTVGDCLASACRAGMDLSLISSLAGTHGANVDAVDEYGDTALMIAAWNGHTAIVNTLAGTHGANVDARDRYGWTALMRAANNGHTDVVTALAGTHGADVEAVNSDGKTALMFAARDGHTATVNALAGTHGANVDAVDNDGRTALMSAAGNGHTDIVNALAGTHGANVDARDRYGRTASMHAAMNGHTDTMNALRACIHSAHSRR